MNQQTLDRWPARCKDRWMMDDEMNAQITNTQTTDGDQLMEQPI